MSQLSIKGIVIGGILDVVLSSLLGIPLVAYIMSTPELSGVPKDRVQPAVVAAMHANYSYHAIQLAVGLGCSALGGYVAARVAKHNELVNGVLSSFLCTAIGIYAISAGKDSGSVLEQGLVLVASPAFALLGGFLRASQVNRRAA